MIDIQHFIDEQLAAWPMARENYEALAAVETRQLAQAKAQFNPARIRSTGAKMDAETLRKRACFLCADKRPKQQRALDWGEYEILVNPYPIFPHHLTIPAKQHAPQAIKGRIADMCRLAEELPGYVVFYNGPRCGASAPDHMHFQAGNADFLPACLPASIGAVRIEAGDIKEVERQFEAVYSHLPATGGEEPMMNVLCRYVEGRYHLTVIPRKKHRPACYGDGKGQMLVSPASVDLAGVIITPLERDFKSITDDDVARIFAELCYTPAELDAMLDLRRSLKVGIMASKEIELELTGRYLLDGDEVTGKVCVSAVNLREPWLLVPIEKGCSAEAKDVTIGVNFHWQRKENQRFVGRILLVPGEGEITLINILPVEDYLTSVISSEMSATSSLQLLKAHAVISRSWVLAQIEKKNKPCPPAEDETVGPEGVPMRIRWYGGNDHTIFDVCADDHCQRYQGITRQTTPTVAQAVKETEGEVLRYNGELCDTRFSKSCGGVFEEFEACWEPEHKGYLVGNRDWADGVHPDLSIEENAREWILSSPDSFCNTDDKEILSQVLNGYDQETADFYRWTVEYDTDALSELVARKSGIDFGRIVDLVPLQRGTSGRIIVLRIVGEKRTMDIGKELEIRRILSESHLYSSAFVVEKTANGFRLRGAGWGHGVGLCQIGAAVMAARGYGYRQILAHYYPGSEISQDNE